MPGTLLYHPKLCLSHYNDRGGLCATEIRQLKVSFQQLTILSLTAVGLMGSTDVSYAGTGYVLEQSGKLAGPQTIVVSDSAVKISESKTGITYLCQKPQWRWQIFNEHNNRFYECTPENFKGTASERVVLFLHDKLAKQKFFKIAPAKIMNQPVVRFWSFLATGTLDGDHPPPRRRFIQVSMLADERLPEAVRQAVGRMIGLPLGGVPLDVVYIDEFDGMRKALLTVHLEKKPLGKEIFAVPKKGQAVKTENEVYTQPERDEDITEIFKSR